mgnify:CR=1 FL=1
MDSAKAVRLIRQLTASLILIVILSFMCGMIISGSTGGAGFGASIIMALIIVGISSKTMATVLDAVEDRDTDYRDRLRHQR